VIFSHRRRLHAEALAPLLLALLALSLPVAVAAAPADTATAASADTTAAAPADTTAAAPADTTAAPPAGGLSALLAGGGDFTDGAVATAETDLPFIIAWDRKPQASMKAEIRKVNYTGKFTNDITTRDKSMLNVEATWSNDDFRRQDKTVERRDGMLNFKTDSTKPLTASLLMNSNWSEDRSTNTTGVTNLNKRDFKQAEMKLKRSALYLAGTENELTVGGLLTDQKGEQQNRRSDFSDAQLSGAWRSAFEPADGLIVHTGVYKMTKSGERSLAEQTESSKADGDSLRGGVFYRRGRLAGKFGVQNSSFSKRYLDYRRNSNGIIDTLNVAEENKIVEELEKNDVTSLSLDNTLKLGRLGFTSLMARDLSEDSFRYSGVGAKLRHQDRVNLGVTLRVGRLDSLKATYGYLYKWDDQTYQGAPLSRGRQVNKRRDVAFTWVHDLFATTRVVTGYKSALSQDVAQNEFNNNDRDRLEESFSAGVATLWESEFEVGLSFDYRRIEDIAIRRERSSNNNVKETYEVAPNYTWPVADWMKLRQDYRVWIQYTDYSFSDLAFVDKNDIYNKRANMTTTVDLEPNKRLKLTIRHELSAKSNATRTGIDASGNSYYFTDEEQTISKIDFTLKYKANDWLTLHGTTYQTKDEKDSFGTRARTSDRRSGKVGVGGAVDKRWGSSGTLKATVRKYYAYGSSVQETSKDYWDADIRLSWGF